jgi:ribosomal protein RSM22 (predicted rRNA methylase)
LSSVVSTSTNPQAIDFDEAELFDIVEDEGDFDENDDGALQPWKKLLEIPGRAAWRVSDPHPPDHLVNSMHQILDDGDRTTKQLRRSHRKVLAIHNDLAEMRERERRRLVNDPSSGNARSGFVMDHDENSISPVYYGFDETLATLKHRLIPNYAITKRVLSECQSLLGGTLSGKWKPKRIVDYGIGCGSATAAAIDLFGLDEGCDVVEWVHGIEPSLPMRECSQRLIEGMVQSHASTTQTMARPPRVTYSNSLTLSQDGDDASGSFDLALFAYTATDLADVTSCMAAAALLFDKLKPNGIFVMIEPGTPDGFNSIRAVRNMLLDCCPPDDPEFEWDERCHILAPCTHNGSCPMERHKKNFSKQRWKLGHDVLQDSMDDLDFEDERIGKQSHSYEREESIDSNAESDEDFVELSGPFAQTEAFNSSFCSFVQHVPGDAARKGEKFSYLVAQKKKFSEPLDAALAETDAFRDYNLTETLAQAFDAAETEDDKVALATFRKVQEMRTQYLESEDDELGLELIRGTAKRRSMGRIVRAPIKKKGHVYIDYCAAPGRIVRSRTTKAMSNNIAPGMFGAARKSRWGGLWPDLSQASNEKNSKG